MPDRTLDQSQLDAFVELVGTQRWAARQSEIAQRGAAGPRAGKAILQRHAVELAIARLYRRSNRAPTAAELLMAEIAGEAVNIAETLTPNGRDQLRSWLHRAMVGDETLIPVFHLVRTAAMQRARGFAVGFPGLEDEAPFDLLLARHGVEAEVVCNVISAEEGRGVHRGAWFRLADRIDPELQTWLATHPGRYLLKMTLPEGLQGGLGDAALDGDRLSVLHTRIRALLETRRQAEQDAAIALRLDPLLLAGAQANELGLLSSLRREFGPEAHLSVTAGGGGVFVMAARAGRENEVAAAVRRRMAIIAPERLTGTRPGILAMFVEDTDRAEWRSLRERLELEGETRQFLTFPEARPVVAVTCVSRLEMFGLPAPDAAPDGEIRFRNPAHPSAKAVALAPAVLSSV